MRILTRYVMDSFLAVFLLAFAVVSIVLTITLLKPLSDYVFKGVGIGYLLQITAVGFHEMLQLTLPLALFVASVITFARLRGDGELDAMRTCGVRLGRIAAAPLALAVLLSGVNLWLNAEVIPREHELRRRLKADLLLTSGFRQVDPGKTVRAIPGMLLRFEGRDGETMLGLTAQDLADPAVPRLLTADRTRMVLDRKDVYFDLENMAVEPLDAEKTLRLRAGRFHYLLRNAFSVLRNTRRDKDMTSAELLRRAREYDSEVCVYGDVVRWGAVSARIEFGRRIVYALAPFCFVLLGIAFGAGTSRGDMMRAGVPMLMFLIAYYMFVMLVTTMERQPALHPEILVYLPPIAALVIGIRRIRTAL